ncbi:Non-specific serine/threonine protein kinase [Sulfidibacter corallicola]
MPVTPNQDLISSIREVIESGFGRESHGDRGAARVLEEIRTLLAGREPTRPPENTDPFDALLDGGIPALRDLVSWEWQMENPDRVGPYRIIRQLGFGGMGTVFLARRLDGTGGPVALKILKSIDPYLRSRFERERRILTRLNHPHITPMVDSGLARGGVPWFAMSYVQGLPLDRWCDHRELSIRERVGLFVKVCRAVAYAHGNHIIHRDIKPANIMVSDDGEPRLLDFGIASLLDPDSGEQLTASRVGLMTPEYASPEQIAGGPLNARTDVFSLGVVLYELLCGLRPFTPSKDERISFREVFERDPRTFAASLARHRDPDKLAETRGSHVKSLQAQLTGKLEHIVRKALRGQAAARYATVDAFADDLQCWLAGLPITARPKTLAYRFGKLMYRAAHSLTGAPVERAWPRVRFRGSDRHR